MWQENGKTATLLVLLDGRFPKSRDKFSVLPVEVKQSEGKVVPPSELRVGVFLEEMQVANDELSRAVDFAGHSHFLLKNLVLVNAFLRISIRCRLILIGM